MHKQKYILYLRQWYLSKRTA